MLKDAAKAPEEGRAFAKSLPEGSSIVTVLYHGKPGVPASLAEGRPALVNGDAVHLGVSSEDVAETANALYKKLNG